MTWSGSRKYLTKDELAVLLEETFGIDVRLWDMDQTGEFLGLYYDGDLIKITTPGECGHCGGTGEVCYSSTSYGPCPECVERNAKVPA
jgi:hypothetical protein